MALKDIKNKIRAVHKIRQVTKAMEAVSAVKMRRAQASALEGRPYAVHALNVLRRISASVNVAEHPLIHMRGETGKTGIVVITSDRGLAGALNSNILRAANKLIKEHGWSKENVSILAIGKRGAEHFEKRGYELIDRIERWGEGIALGNPSTLARQIIERYNSHEYRAFYIVYNNFLSTFSQEPVVRTLLPISVGGLQKVIENIVPVKGKFSELREEGQEDLPREYLFEPSPEAVLDELVPELLAIELYHAVLESNASEHSARMVAMKSASDRARDVAKELNLTYNKQRQSAITAEVSEITSGIEAMK
jgi:F-type H+-transporting ATPase subunit gamma